MTTNIVEIQNTIKTELAKKEVLNALVSTTFKGLATPQVYLAIQEGMMRGFNFQDFLEKNVYAIPFKGGYSLVTSVDYARKVGMKSGVVGTSEPIYEEKDGKIISCTVTVKRKVGDYVGDYSAKVYFSEYSTGRNLWLTKPRTMIAKVAEMHALRKACPEVQSYVEEELETEIKELPRFDLEEEEKTLRAVKNLDELKKVWADMPIEVKQSLEKVKNELKAKFTPNENS